MRRKDREITDPCEIEQVIERCDSLTLALNGPDGYPYCVEMNFGYKDGVLWLHSAKEGTKLDLILKDGRCGFSMSTAHDLVPGKVPCAATFRYESVCGRGRIEIVSGEEAIRGLSVILKHYLPDDPSVFDSRHTAAITMLRLDILSMTGKRRFNK